VYAQPQNYKPSDPVREVTLSIAWSGGQRLDIAPASCGDPQCEADHGYTGTIAREDIGLRISAEADGLQAVQDAKDFARALRAANTSASASRAVNSTGGPAGTEQLGGQRAKLPTLGPRLNRSHHDR